MAKTNQIHEFGAPRPKLGKTTKKYGSNKFQELPDPTGPAPYRLDIEKVTGELNSKKIVFHTVGDTGGVKDPIPQKIVVDKMEEQFSDAKVQAPSFFYHIGDVVYYNGEEGNYNDQFFDPYMHYPAPILAIPGNHDGDIDESDPNPPTSLKAFVEMFCDTAPHHPRVAGDAPRTTMIQPNVYWTLLTPLANIVGLYTNVPEHGEIKDDQRQWFISELQEAQKQRKSKALIVALHHPAYSIDHDHGASSVMQKFLDDVFNEVKIWPDLILTGHVHNYQRFTRTINDKQIPYIVAGAGGYWNLHKVGSKENPVYVPNDSFFEGVVLEEYCDDRHGFMRITIDSTGNSRKITGEYFTVPRPQESWSAPPVLYDYFVIDLNANTVTNIKH